MFKILFILVIISILFPLYFALTGQILASETPENQNGSIPEPPSAKAPDIGYAIKTAKKIFIIFDWIENASKKAWAWLSRAYFWIKDKMHQPVEQISVILKYQT